MPEDFEPLIETVENWLQVPRLFKLIPKEELRISAKFEFALMVLFISTSVTKYESVTLLFMVLGGSSYSSATIKELEANIKMNIRRNIFLQLNMIQDKSDY